MSFPGTPWAASFSGSRSFLEKVVSDPCCVASHSRVLTLVFLRIGAAEVIVCFLVLVPVR